MIRKRILSLLFALALPLQSLQGISPNTLTPGIAPIAFRQPQWSTDAFQLQTFWQRIAQWRPASFQAFLLRRQAAQAAQTKEPRKFFDIRKWVKYWKHSVEIGTLIIKTGIFLYFINFTIRTLSMDTAIVIDSITTPEAIAQLGYSSEAFQKKVTFEIRSIEQIAQITKTDAFHFEFKDRPVQQFEIPDHKKMEFEVPETGLSTKIVEEAGRKLLGHEPAHISGEITMDADDPEKPSDTSHYYFTLHDSSHEDSWKKTEILIDAEDPDQLVSRVAEEILREKHPEALALYLLFIKLDRAELEKLIQDVIRREAPNAEKEWAHVLRSTLRAAAATPAEAESIFKEVERIYPNSATLYANWGITLDIFGRRRDSIEKYKKSILLDPKSAAVHLHLGKTLEAQHDVRTAIAEYQKAKSLAPKNADICTALGFALFNDHRYAEALAEFRRGIALSPSNERVSHGSIAEALTATGQLSEAIVEYRKATASGLGAPIDHVHFGILLDTLGRPKEATSEFDAAIKTLPNYALAHAYLAFALTETGDFDRAIQESRRAIALAKDYAPTGTYVHNSLGWALYKKGFLDEAAMECRQAIALKPDNARAHSDLGVVLQAQGKKEEALAEFRNAVMTFRATFPPDPENSNAFYRLGTALKNQKRLSEAFAVVHEGMAKNPWDTRLKVLLEILRSARIPRLKTAVEFPAFQKNHTISIFTAA